MSCLPLGGCRKKENLQAASALQRAWRGQVAAAVNFTTPRQARQLVLTCKVEALSGTVLYDTFSSILARAAPALPSLSPPGPQGPLGPVEK